MRKLALATVVIASTMPFSTPAASLDTYLEWKNARGESAAVGQANMVSLEAGMGSTLEYIRAPDGSLKTDRFKICAPKSVRFTPNVVASALDTQFETFKDSGGFTTERRNADMIVHVTR